MEIMLEDEDKPGMKPPRTMTVMVFLAAFAVVMSWISCYAVPNALIAADVLKPFGHEADPRPRWMVTAFVIIFAASSILGSALGVVALSDSNQAVRINADLADSATSG